MPYNMPVLSLKAEDQPLRFCWHDWSPSFQRLRGWELIVPFMPKDEEASAPTVLGLWWYPARLAGGWRRGLAE